MEQWNGKTIVITGGSSGLGYAIAEAFARRRANLVILSRNIEQLDKAVQQLQTFDVSVQGISTDITKDDDVERSFSQIEAETASIDGLVNAAGISARQAILDTTPEDFQKLWELNFQGLVRCTRRASTALLRSKGHLINIGSLASKTASRYLGAYPASKFAVAAYSQQLRLELGPEGLHVLLVCPGPIRREDAGMRYSEAAKDLPPEAMQPGGAARVKAIDPAKLAERIIWSCEHRRPELIMPASARWLFAISQLWPGLGDRIVLNKTRGGKSAT